jgi:hypothetical protein
MAFLSAATTHANFSSVEDRAQARKLYSNSRMGLFLIHVPAWHQAKAQLHQSARCVAR